jgi:hypothetical protein
MLNMRIAVSIALLLWLSIVAVAQEKEQWRRVYTFDDGVVEMNTAKVTYGERSAGRVQFRWMWDKPLKLKETPEVSYKARLEVIEFKRPERRYRIFETTLLDAKGNAVRATEQDPSAEWKATKFGGFMEKLFNPACGLIEEKRRKPSEREEQSRPLLKRKEPAPEH